MISRSDNTGADMTLAHAGADRVRAFIASIGLHDTRIPTSTRQFIGYITGQPDWQGTTWAQVEADTNYPSRPIINDQITMVSTPEDFVSFYSRALQGEFFRYPETLAQFRAILSLADAIALAMPLGVSAFLKGGGNQFQWGSRARSCRWHVHPEAVGILRPDHQLGPTAEADSAGEVQQQYIVAANTIFTLMRDRLGV